MKKVKIAFELGEQVTPQIFALKVAFACARLGALRPDESVVAGGIRFKVKVGGEGHIAIIQEPV